MKIRTGFVSNSSSASFVVNIDKINAKDALRLMEYNSADSITFSATPREWKDSWSMTVDYDRGVIRGFTSMDNGDLGEYMFKHGIDEDLFVWENY